MSALVSVFVYNMVHMCVASEHGIFSWISFIFPFAVKITHRTAAAAATASTIAIRARIQRQHHSEGNDESTHTRSQCRHHRRRHCTVYRIATLCLAANDIMPLWNKVAFIRFGSSVWDSLQCVCACDYECASMENRSVKSFQRTHCVQGVAGGHTSANQRLVDKQQPIWSAHWKKKAKKSRKENMKRNKIYTAKRSVRDKILLYIQRIHMYRTHKIIKIIIHIRGIILMSPS